MRGFETLSAIKRKRTCPLVNVVSSRQISGSKLAVAFCSMGKECRLRADIVASATVGKVSIFVFPFSGGDDGTGTRNRQPRLKLCAGWVFAESGIYFINSVVGDS